MFPITSFTASLGHDGNIDIFALALSPQAQPGQGVPVFRIRQKPVFRIRQKKAGGEWHPWATAGKPGHGAVGVRSITDSEGHEMLGTSQRSSQHSDPGTLRRIVLTSGWPTTEGGHEMFSYTRGRRGRMRKYWPLLPVAAILLAGAAVAVPARAAASQHPYRLVDPGTFGGPQSFLNLPAVPLTSNGALLGTADTATHDADYPKCNPFMVGFPDRYLVHAFAWHNGRLRDLGALPGNNSSAVFEVNGSGVGAGMSETAITDPNTGWPADHAVMFKGGKVTDLGTLPGGFESQANDINNRGQVSGFASNGIRDKYSFFKVFGGPGPCGPSGWGTQARSFVWQNGVMRDIGTLGGPDAVMTTQNARGQITGQSWTSSTPNPATGIPTLDPFLWAGGHMRDLGNLGGTIGFANWLNDRGEVVGVSDLAADQTAHPFLWANGHLRDLGTLGGDFGFANSVNERGFVVGGAQAADQNFHGFLWRDGKMHDLPPVGGAPWAFANSVNDHGQVAGNTTDAKGNERFAVLWSGGHGYNLNALIAPSKLHLASAEYINDQGEIVGHGVLPNGNQRVFLLIRNPSVPLPPAAARSGGNLPAARLPHLGHLCGTTPLPGPCWAARSLVPG